MKLPQVPEMIFADNILRITHEGGFGIEFNALEALKLVDAEHDHLKVAMSKVWREARCVYMLLTSNDLASLLIICMLREL